MRRSIRAAVTVVVAWACWSLPLISQATAVIQYSAQTDTQIAGVLSDRSGDAYVAFSALNENGLVTLRIDLDRQSIMLRKRANELHIASSLNRGRTFSTLQQDEKDAIRRAVAIMDDNPQGSFHTEIACMMRQFGGWPAGMPLMVSKDHLKTTVGDVSVANKDIEQARQEALARDLPGIPGDSLPAPAIVSLCNFIGRASRLLSDQPLSLQGEVRQLAGGRAQVQRTLRHHLQRTVLGPAVHRRLPEPRSVHRSLGAQSFVLPLHLVPRVRRLLQRSGLHRFTRRVDVEVNV